MKTVPLFRQYHVARIGRVIYIGRLRIWPLRKPASNQEGDLK